MGRFVNGDGYADTGVNLTSSNMFAYCGNNPVNYSDPSGSCPYNGTAADFHRLEHGLPPINCTCVGKVFEATVKGMDLAVSGAKIGVEIGKHVYTTAPRPNNIGPGTYIKYTSTRIMELNKVSSVVDSLSSSASILGIAVDVGNGIDTNLKNGESAGLIMWDVTIDATFSSLNTVISTYACTATITLLSSFVCPPLGIAIGIMIGYTVDLALTYISNQPREQVKGFY